MYERILIPVDGSEISDRALQHAVALARQTGGKVCLLHVIDELGIDLGETPTVDAFWAAARKAGHRILDEASRRASEAGVDAEKNLVEIRTFGAVMRRVADVIDEEARRWRADLIVIGSHGRRGVGKVLLGSVAEAVLRTAPVPVLLFREREAA